jgi:sugar/nucleoside kinase (ribokinase family)
VPKLFAAARDRGLSISLDTNYDPSERWDGRLREALRYVDVFMPNQTELLAITGAADLDTALEHMARQTPLVGVKLGAQGAAARRGDQIARAAALPVEVADTTGAGDSFDAGFVYGYLKGWDLQRTLRLACACGSLSTRAAGGTAAQPTLAEALAAMLAE